MAKTCIFCGRELGFFSQENTVCGEVDQPTCSQCYETLRDLSQRERGERALATGRAVDPEKIMAYLEQAEEREKAAKERREQARRAIQTDRTCLRCGGPMEKCGLKYFHLGDEGLFGPVARDGLFASWLEAEVFRCAHCGWGEFYLPQPPELPADLQQEEQVTCPVCGTRHSPLGGCPRCAMNMGQRRSTAAREGTKRPEKKPPWEK